MRIALLAPGFSAHSADWAIPALLNLARGLARSVELHVFSQRYPAAGLARFDGLVHHALGGGPDYGLASLRTWLRSAGAVIRQHRRTPFDGLHAFWADEAGFSAALAGAAIGRPVLVSLGGGELTRLPDIGYGAQRFLARRLTTGLALRRAALVTAGSLYQLELARAHGVPPARLRLAPLGVDTGLFRPPAQAPPLAGPVLVQAASLLPVKNQALLLELLRRVRQEIPACRLHLAGAGSLQADLVRQAARLGLAGAITWAGQRPYPAMPGFYAAGHLYLQTSHHESQGLAVLEALACGLPVLGTPVGLARELAARPASFSAETLAGQAVALLADPAGYAGLRDQARQVVVPAFGLAVTVDRFLALYAGLALTPSLTRLPSPARRERGRG